MSKLEIKKLSAYQQDRFYLEIDADVSIHYSGDSTSYDFRVYFDNKSIYNKLIKIQKDEGYLMIGSLEDNWGSDNPKDKWHYIIKGSISGLTPFQHASITKTLVNAING